MTRIRLGLAVTILLTSAASAHSAPVVEPQTEVIERLAPAFATGDPARIANAYRSMGNYGLPAAYFVESSINAMGYRHLERDDIDAAIAVFELNTETFPLSANTWDSLAEAIMLKGDHETAIFYFRRSLDLNPENANAAQMIDRIVGEQQFSHVSDNGS